MSLTSSFSPDNVACLRYFVRHPLLCALRLMRIASKNDRVRQMVLLRNLASGLPDRIAGKFMEEINHLMDMPPTDDDMLPYPLANKEPIEVEGGFDKKKGLPYVMHKGRRLYGRKDQRYEDVARYYRYCVGDEGLLGTGRRTKSPHAYVDAGFRVEHGDVVVDIGCSDALFAFDNAELADKIYLFEAWKRWMPALEASFDPFKKKTRIISKIVSDKTGKNEIRLADAIEESGSERYFIKMDIEGAERAVISSSADFLRNNKVKLSCCVYHRQDDAKVISGMLKELGFSFRYSDGYVLSPLNDMICPYFRHGVLYARNYP
jgi:hypothetical protein